MLTGKGAGQVWEAENFLRRLTAHVIKSDPVNAAMHWVINKKRVGNWG